MRLFAPAVFVFGAILGVSCQEADASLSLQHPLTEQANSDFEVFGDARFNSAEVVLTRDNVLGGRGAIWAKRTNPHQYWEVSLSIGIRGAEIGGKGLALWYTTQRGLAGNAFGSVEPWDGLGIFFDPNTDGKVIL
jgi:Legume-like lectin family